MNRLALLSTLVLATALTSATPTPQTDSATAKIEPLKISYTLSGTFVPAVYHDIQLQTREVTGAKVLWAAPHGQIVRKGDALIRLDTEDIERIIRDKALALELAEIDLKLAIELNRLREFNTPRDIAFHKRAATRTKDDYLSFVNTFRKLEERNVEIDRKSADYSLLSAQEELAQLKKMYAADDLAEETEEMLLKRQQWSVDYWTFKVHKAKINETNAKTVTIPRKLVDLKRTMELKARDEKTYLCQLPLIAAKQKTELQQKQIATAKIRSDLAKLRTVAAALVLRAPTDGVVYYGRYAHGAFTPFKAASAKLLPGAFLKANDIAMTIAETKTLHLECSIKESLLSVARAGQAASIRATGFVQTRHPAKLEHVSLVPRDGKFILRFSLSNSGSLRPGMTATGWWTAYNKPDALVVPAAFVFGDAEGDYVWREAKRTPVRLGHSYEGKTEIVSGLTAGDVVTRTANPAKK